MELSIAELRAKDLFIAQLRDKPIMIKPFAERERSRAFITLRQKGFIERISDEESALILPKIRKTVESSFLSFTTPIEAGMTSPALDIELYVPTIPFTFFDRGRCIMASPAGTFFLRYRSHGHNTWYAINAQGLIKKR
jgi:hypothetical protein